MHSTYLNAIKAFEGYATNAKWDYSQHTNGFGTRARFAGETITRAEAEQRFAAEIDQARQIVEKQAANWDEGTKAALTSLTFNAGTQWISSGLGDAVRRHDTEAVKEKFLQYTKAGGSELPGLVRRRFVEMGWIGNPAAATAGNPPASVTASTHDTDTAGTPAAGSAVVAPGSPQGDSLAAEQGSLLSPAVDGTTDHAADVRHSRSRLAIGETFYWTMLKQIMVELAANPASERSDDRDPAIST